MTLTELLQKFNVVVIDRRTNHGLVEIGPFKTDTAAQQFVNEVTEVSGCNLPDWNPIELHSQNEFQVVVNIGEFNSLFTQLPELRAYPLF